MKNLAMATLVSGAMVAGLTGCASTGATNNGMNGIGQNKAVLGGVLGALGGAGISKATGGNKTGRDAAIGAALGAGVGYYMQQQEAKLRQDTAGSGVTVTRDPVTNNINLAIPEAITFDVARYAIKSGFYPTLNKVASTLNQFNQSSVAVNGYASVEGNANSNQILSQNRANAVAQYLVNQGVAGNRISAYGRGATTQFGSSYDQNRRVEVTIVAPKNVQ